MRVCVCACATAACVCVGVLECVRLCVFVCGRQRMSVHFFEILHSRLQSVLAAAEHAVRVADFQLGRCFTAFAFEVLLFMLSAH